MESGVCPPLNGSAALQWIVPQTKSGATLTCTLKSSTDFSPVATADEIQVCEWPGPPDVYVNVERYSDRNVADAACHRVEDWVVDGVKFGAAGSTGSDNYGERWWCYDDSPLVINLSGPLASIQSLASELVFRTPAQLRDGHL